jgi:hypothetical protein
MRVAIFDSARQFAPIVRGLVGMLTLTKDRKLAAGFISRTEKCGSGCGGGRYKSTSRYLHGTLLIAGIT